MMMKWENKLSLYVIWKQCVHCIIVFVNVLDLTMDYVQNFSRWWTCYSRFCGTLLFMSWLAFTFAEWVYRLIFYKLSYWFAREQSFLFNDRLQEKGGFLCFYTCSKAHIFM